MSANLSQEHHSEMRPFFIAITTAVILLHAPSFLMVFDKWNSAAFSELTVRTDSTIVPR